MLPKRVTRYLPHLPNLRNFLPPLPPQLHHCICRLHACLPSPFAPWLHRRKHLLVLQDPYTITVTATDTFTTLSHPTTTTSVHPHPSSSSAQPPSLPTHVQSEWWIYCSKSWILIFNFAYVLGDLTIVIAHFPKVLPQAICNCCQYLAAFILLVITARLCIDALQNRLLAFAEKATNGPLVLSQYEDTILIGDQQIPFREARMFTVASLVGLGRRLWLLPVKAQSFGIALQTINGAFVLGFIEDRTACADVAERLNQVLRQTRAQLAHPEPPEIDLPQTLTSEFLQAYSACSKPRDGASLLELNPETFRFRRRPVDMFTSATFLEQESRWAFVVFVKILLGYGWKSLESGRMPFYNPFTLVHLPVWLLWRFYRRNVLWWYVNKKISTKAFCVLTMFRWTAPEVWSIQLVAEELCGDFALYTGLIVGVRAGGGYGLDLNRWDGPRYRLVSGLKEAEAVAAAFQLCQMQPKWFLPPQMQFGQQQEQEVEGDQ